MDGQTMLHLAAFNGHHAIVEMYLNRGSDINERNGAFKTPLHLAASNGKTDVVELLVLWGAKTTACLRNGMTARHLAEENGHSGIVDLLREHPGGKDGMIMGWTALPCAAAVGDKERVRALLDAGVDVGALDHCGKTALYLAVEGGHVLVVRLLLRRISRPDKDITYGETELHIAANHGHLEIVQALLGWGVDIHASAEDRATTLHIAARAGHSDTVRALLVGGANIESTTILLETPLHLAVMHHATEAIVVLLAYGAEIGAVTLGGHTALSLAVSPLDREVILAEENRRAKIALEAQVLAEVAGAVAGKSTAVVDGVDYPTNRVASLGEGDGDTKKKVEVVRGIAKVGKKTKVWHAIHILILGQL